MTELLPASPNNTYPEVEITLTAQQLIKFGINKTEE
jgi:hypothetical protein